MDSHGKDVVREMTKASEEERIVFPDVVQALIVVGLERYHADLIRSNNTYYMADDGFEVTARHAVGPPAQRFDASGVEAAVRAIQAQSIRYREFCERIAAARCLGYLVTIVGRRAVYYGGEGDSHIEWFAGAK